MDATSTNRAVGYPCRLRLGPDIPVAANVATTVTVRVCRTDSSVITAKLVCLGNQISGVAADVSTTAAEATKTITGATNATPIVIASTAHGYSTGDRVLIAAVGGNTNANSNWTIAVVDADHYSLNGSAGNSNYTSGGTSNRWELLSISFTPTRSGSVYCEVQAYGGTTNSVYVDNGTVSGVVDTRTLDYPSTVGGPILIPNMAYDQALISQAGNSY